jgi:hypothetical protein
MSAVKYRDDVLYRLKGWLSCCCALLLLLAATTPWCVDGFATTKKIHPRLSTTTTTTTTTQTTWPLLQMNSYGRGAEIWPECNEDPVQLSDSFPNGQVPYSAVLAIGRQDMAAVYENVEESITATSNTPAPAETAANNNNNTPTTRSKRQFVSKTVRRILRRAAAKEELGSEAGGAAAAATLSNRLDWTPIFIASGLLAGGLVRPNDVLLVAFFTTYFTLLGMVARSPREISGAPVLPAMPPQGHVPSLVSNPLGMGIVYSKTYDMWLKLGVVVGLVGPLIQLSWYLQFGPQQEIEAARRCARPMFLLCFQAISEAASRRVVVRLVMCLGMVVSRP